MLYNCYGNYAYDMQRFCERVRILANPSLNEGDFAETKKIILA
jgi:hypothetical protein